MNSLLLLTAVSGLLCSFHQSLGQCKQVFEGVIVNQLGTPVPGATIYLEQKSIRDGQSRQSESDVHGRFLTVVSEPGVFLLLPTKVSEGYPDLRFAFYNVSPPQEVQSNCGGTVTGLIVKLPPKAATLNLRVRLQSPEVPAPNAMATLTREDKPGLYIRLSASSPILVPVGVPLRVLVEQEGFKSVTLRNVLLAAEQTRQVLLQPAP